MAWSWLLAVLRAARALPAILPLLPPVLPCPMRNNCCLRCSLRNAPARAIACPACMIALRAACGPLPVLGGCERCKLLPRMVARGIVVIGMLDAKLPPTAQQQCQLHACAVCRHWPLSVQWLHVHRLCYQGLAAAA